METGKLWFRAKRYGWGWYPVTWQGWAVLLLYAVAITINAVNATRFAQSASDVVIGTTVPILVDTVFLIIICYVKGEPSKWRWGGK
jgi:hypothetical protein